MYGQIRYEQRPYKSTSVLFYTDEQENYVLLAHHKELNKFSDFGGKRQGKRDRSFFDTAYRELLDELFGWKIIPYYFIDEISYTLDQLTEQEVDQKIEIHIKNDVHVLIILTEKHLERLLQICKHSGRDSAYYDKFPVTVYELVRKRKYTKKQTISELQFFKLSELSFDEIDPRTHDDLNRLNIILERRYEHSQR